jgi:Polyphosphate kinase 2 (PPK2)
VWKRHFRDINDWERDLSENWFRIVKLFLNLSREEQRMRFLRFPKVSREQREALLEIKQSLEAHAPEGAAHDPFAQPQQDGQPQGGKASLEASA